MRFLHSLIIPYQELLGNYDQRSGILVPLQIIPYQEILGNYDLLAYFLRFFSIIPYQELLVNHPPPQ